MSSVDGSYCLQTGTFLLSLCVDGFSIRVMFFQNLWPIWISQRAQLFRVLAEGKELLLSTQKLLSIRSQTLRGVFTAGLDCSKSPLSSWSQRLLLTSIQREEESFRFYVFISNFLLLTACSVWALTLVDDGVSEPTNDVISGTDVIFKVCQEI